MALLVPLLIWSAFLLLAFGARWWAVAPWVLGMIAAVSFPPGLLKSSSRDTKEPAYLRWLSLPGLALVYYWLVQQPEVHSLYARVMSGKALLHWAVVSASLVYLAAAMYRRWRAVNLLTDQEIYDFFKTPRRLDG